MSPTGVPREAPARAAKGRQRQHAATREHQRNEPTACPTGATRSSARHTVSRPSSHNSSPAGSGNPSILSSPASWIPSAPASREDREKLRSFSPNGRGACPRDRLFAQLPQAPGGQQERGTSSPGQRTGCGRRWRSSSGSGRPRPPTSPRSWKLLPVHDRPRQDRDFRLRRRPDLGCPPGSRSGYGATGDGISLGRTTASRSARQPPPSVRTSCRAVRRWRTLTSCRQ